jgi:predicted lipid-binding transport protein (Tim44 family)
MDQPAQTIQAPPVRVPRFPRSVVLVGAAIVALVAVALVVAVARPSRSIEYPIGSPEAAFQAFYTAWQDGDLETAYGYFSRSVTAEMTLAEYEQADSDQSWSREQGRRVVLLGAEVDGDRASVELRVDEFYEEGMGERFTSTYVVALVRDGAAWLVDEPLLGIDPIWLS